MCAPRCHGHCAVPLSSALAGEPAAAVDRLWLAAIYTILVDPDPLRPQQLLRNRLEERMAQHRQVALVQRRVHRFIVAHQPVPCFLRCVELGWAERHVDQREAMQIEAALRGCRQRWRHGAGAVGSG